MTIVFEVLDYLKNNWTSVMDSTLVLSSHPHPADGLVGTAKLWLEAWLGRLVVKLKLGTIV